VNAKIYAKRDKTNPRMPILMLSYKKFFSKFFGNFIKMQEFQITGSDQMWVLNETLENFKTND
jgi:hypothetical protein